MKQNIDVDELTLKKLKLISVYENMSVETDEENEDIALLALMQEGSPTDTVPEEDIVRILQ